VTVLSACLGLVIAGVPAQIQAQPTTARTAGEPQSASGVPQCSEAATPEVEKLLDHKKFISPPFLAFVAEVRELIVRGDLYDLDISLDAPFLGHVDHMTINRNSGSEMSSAAAEEFASEVETFLRITDALFYEQGIAHLSVTFKTTASELIANIVFKQHSPEHARKLVASFNAMFSAGGCRERGEPSELFYTNTKALTDNDQVLIVTRLPRAGLDVPLVEKPVAN
jgi:hypothetical protein